MSVRDKFLNVRWRAQPDDLIGGWCVTPSADKRSPAEGAVSIADFCHERAATHIAQLHNNWLEDSGRNV